MSENNASTDSYYKEQLNLLFERLSSARPSEVWHGMEQAREGLNKDPEDSSIYGVLLDAFHAKPELKNQIRDLFLELMQSGSKSAKNALLALPSTVEDFLADADDAYYASEYGQAIELYRQVIKLDPENSRAKNQLEKAEKNKIVEESKGELPRSAIQYYRRACSSLATRDVITAMNLLDAAIEAARGKGMDYPEAEEQVNRIQDLLTANEFRQQARAAISKHEWKYALVLFNKAIEYDPKNSILISEKGELERKILTNTLLRAGGIVGLFFGISILIFFFINKFSSFPMQEASQNTPTSTISVSTATSAITPDTPSATPYQTPTQNSFTENPNEMIQPTPSEVPSLGKGYINLDYVTAWETPEGGVVTTLGLNQPVTILDKQDFGQFTYLKCSWEINGIQNEGWILEQYLNLGVPPEL